VLPSCEHICLGRHLAGLSCWRALGSVCAWLGNSLDDGFLNHIRFSHNSQRATS